MAGSRAPRIALSAIGGVALLACGELVARIQGDRLCLETPGAVLEAEPRFGWRHVPGLAAWVRPCAAPATPAVGIDVTEAGLLDLQRTRAKPQGARRILLLGGDLPSPLGVRHPLGLRPTSLARLLEARADARRGAPLEVVDATTPGFALDNHWLYLEAEGLGYAPDLVVAIVDPARDVLALSPRLLAAEDTGAPDKPYLRLDGSDLAPATPLRATAPAPPPPPPWPLAHSHLYRFLAGIPSRPGTPVGRVDAPPARDRDAAAERTRMRALAAAILARLRDSVHASGARLAIALAPLGPGAEAGARIDARHLAAEAERLAIPLVDLGPPFAAFGAASGRSPHLDGSRDWNADGHFVASEALWGFLQREELLPAGVVPARILEGGQVRDPRRIVPSFLDALERDRRTLFPLFLQLAALAACVVWIAAPLAPRTRDAITVALGVALAAALGSPRFALLVLAFALVVFACAERLRGRGAAIAAAVLLGGFVLWPSLAPAVVVGSTSGEALEVAAFATNVALLRFASHAIERRRARRGEPGAPSLGAYLAATLYFPTFVNGPIQSPADFAAARPDGGIAPASWAELRAHLAASAAAILRAALAVATLYAAWVVLNDKLRLDVFASGGTAVSRPRLWLWVLELYFMFYVSFNAWSTVAIALGRICGARVPENFHRPWAARDPADFWRRWHITLGVWLRRNVYLPLGGSRSGFARNVGAVFLASALWHVWGAVKLFGPTGFGPRAWSGLLLWGAMNAAGVIVAHRLERRSADGRPASAVLDLARRIATFLFIGLAWIPFFLPPGFGPSDCLAVFARLFFLR